MNNLEHFISDCNC